MTPRLDTATHEVSSDQKEATVTLTWKFAVDDLPAGWEPWQCVAGCGGRAHLHARRRSPGEDLWLLYERPGWLIAASEPVCPGCGTALAKAGRKPS